MNKTKINLLFACLIISFTSVFGQLSEAEVKAMILESNEQQLVVNSSRMLQENHYYFAGLVTDQLLKLKPESANYNYRKGFIILGMDLNFETALTHFEKAKDNTSKNFDMYSSKEEGCPVDVFYHLGRCYHLSEKYDKATEFYNKFIEVSNKESELIEEAQLRITQCNIAKELTAKPVDVKINTLEHINTENGEYSSFLSLDGKALYLTSRRPWENDETENMRDFMLNQYPEDIYVSLMDNNKNWGEVKRLDMCKPNLNEASVSFSSDEREVFLYDDSTGFGDIFISEYVGREYKAPTPVSNEGVNTEEGWETHFIKSPDGNTIYFVSDREGGYGKRDIWFIEKTNGAWGEPKNMGPMVNSKYDEDSPYIGLDKNTLYFASNGEKSMGEFDVFSISKDENGMWLEPTNLGYPINSPGDDLFYSTNYTKSSAILTSVRKGGKGNKDVYQIDYNVSDSEGLAFLNGRIINTNDKNIPEGSFISLKCIDCDDKESKKVLPRVRDGVFVSLLEKCKEYEITYHYDDQSSEPYTEKFNTNCDLAFEEINKTVLLVEDDKVIIPLFTYDLAGIVSDRGSSERIPNAKVEIIRAEGDTAEVWSTNENGGFESNLADGLVLGDKLDYTAKISALGYITQTFKIDNVLGKDSIITVSYMLEKDKDLVDIGDVLALNPIYFDFDKSNIRPDAKVELDKVIAVLNNNPKIKIECGSHTDCRGSKKYNRRLSERRAKSTAKYIQKSISNPERVTYKGYGEDVPAKDNNCSCRKCSSEEHQKNRRSEFLIVK